MQNENNKNETLKESKTSPWLDWAVKLQAIAQAGLTYGKDVYDRERYEQIRDIAAEMISLHSGISKEKVVDLFCSETGYQTPKLDTRAAVFQDGKILLVKENNGTWSLPGGWVDVRNVLPNNEWVTSHEGYGQALDILAQDALWEGIAEIGRAHV